MLTDTAPLWGTAFMDERLPPEFWAKVRRGDCWEWTANTHRRYGKFRWNGKTWFTHRLAYETLVGPIPDGLELDHLCRNPPCCNPAHLEPVTHAENLRRGYWAQRTHCENGHELTAANTFTRVDGGRRCRTCQRRCVNESRYRLGQRHPRAA